MDDNQPTRSAGNAGMLPTSDRELARNIGNLAVDVFLVFARPFVLTTKVFFHMELGERWFGEIQAALSVLLIAGATAVSMYRPNAYPHFTYGIGFFLGIAWVLAFLYGTYEHFFIAVPNRYKKGIRWHSRCDGIPRIPGMNVWVQRGIVLAVLVQTYRLGLLGFTALLVMSLLLGIVADQAAAKKFWNQVLDAVDGQIEGEILGNAIEKRLSPAEASGLNVCIPSYVSAESRKKIAEAFQPGRTQRSAAAQTPQASSVQPERPIAASPARSVTESETSRPLVNPLRQAIAAQQDASAQVQPPPMPVHADVPVTAQPASAGHMPKVSEPTAMVQSAPTSVAASVATPAAVALSDQQEEQSDLMESLRGLDLTVEGLDRYPVEKAVIDGWSSKLQTLGVGLSNLEEECRTQFEGGICKPPSSFNPRYFDGFDAEMDSIEPLVTKLPAVAERVLLLRAQKQLLVDWVARLQRDYRNGEPVRGTASRLSVDDLTVAQFAAENVPMTWISGPDVQELPGGVILDQNDREELCRYPLEMLRLLGWVPKLALLEEAVAMAERKRHSGGQPDNVDLTSCAKFEQETGMLREVARQSPVYARWLTQMDERVRRVRERAAAMGIAPRV